MSNAQQPASIRPFVFFDEHRPTRAWMPTIEMLNERFAGNLRAALLQHLQPEIEVTPILAIEVVKHGELIDRLVAPSHLTLVNLRPLRGAMLIVADPELVGWVVEWRFGGSGRLPVAVAKDEFTPIELHAMRRVIDQILRQFRLAWQSIVALEPEVIRHEVRPIFASVTSPTDLLVVSNFDIRIAGGGGRLTIAMPFALLEPLHEKLVSGITDKSSARDPDWVQALQTSVARATTVLQVELAAVEMTVRDFLELQPGNIIEIDRPDSVTVQAHGRPLFRGRWGSHGRKIAVRVEEQMGASAETPSAITPRGDAESLDDER